MDKRFDLILPRNEKELIGLFEDFLFMHTEKFPGFKKEEGDDKFKLNEKDLSLLCETNIVNMIFRRWFQTTWGDRDWSTFFSGETPRQELSHYYTDFEKGNSMLSVEMKKNGNDWYFEPHLFLKKEIVENGGMIVYSLNSVNKNKTGVSAPSFGLGFKKFSEFLLKMEKVAQGLKSYNPTDNEEEKWWRLFWSQVGASLAFNIYLELPQEQIMKIAFELQDCLDYFAQKSGNGPGDFIEIDVLFFHLWDILKKADDRLLTYDEMIDNDERTSNMRMSEKKYLYSTKVFFYLGHMFDEKILFPADRYFGGVECVWTDKNNFIGAMINTTMLLKNNLEKLGYSDKLNKEEKKQADYLVLSGVSDNIERIWFAPPTAFRFLPSVKQFF